MKKSIKAQPFEKQEISHLSETYIHTHAACFARRENI
jgi:hypothetical protein